LEIITSSLYILRINLLINKKMIKLKKISKWQKPIKTLFVLSVIFLLNFAGGGGSNGGGGGKGGSGGSGGGKGGDGGGKSGDNGCDFSNRKRLRVNLGAFLYHPNTVTSAPQFTCGLAGPPASSTPHIFQASLTPYLTTSSFLQSHPNDFLCEVSVVSTCGTGDEIHYPWNSGENFLDIDIYQNMPCIIRLRYIDRNNLEPCTGNTRGGWFEEYTNGGAIINDAAITITPRCIAFLN
jgi:hypothetical protein